MEDKTMLVRYQNKPMMPNLFDELFGHGLMSDIYNRGLFSDMPSANIVEEKEKFMIDLAAPGLDKEDFKINIDERVLTISVEKEEKKEEETNKFTKKEFSYSAFKRSFNLPDSIHVDKIEARYENGILTVNLPKKEEAIVKPVREIKIS